MNRIDRKFRELKRRKQKAFIAFITAGYPNLDVTRKLILKFASIGVDIIELGVPFSDPMADGAVIQEASEAALKKKVNLNRIFELVKDVRRYTQVPICLMTYYNPVFCFSEERFVRLAASCGVDGVIVPDLPMEEAAGLRKLTRGYNLDLIYFLSPTTSLKRLKRIAALSMGFIYYVSLTGVTGPRQKLPSDLAQHLRKIKKNIQKPVCVGFGISRPEQIKQICKIADGVIVGSAIVKKIKDNIGKSDLVKRVSNFVLYLKNG